MKFSNRFGKSTIVILATFLLIFTLGCSAKFGSFNEKSHFAFPNSNVKPLGQVNAETTKTSFIVPPSLDATDVRELLSQALKQKAGADLVINYKVDTKITVIPIPIFSYYTLTMTLSGTAVSMETGEKELMETIKQVGY